jgi:hypothetical protein
MNYLKPAVELMYIYLEEGITTGSVEVSVGGDGNSIPLIEDVENAPDLNKGFDFQV